MAKPYRRPDSRFWWIAPWIDGVQVRQSSGETDYDRALRKLRILEGRIAANAPITAATVRDSFEALLELVKLDYAINDRASIEDMRRRCRLHISPRLGHLTAGKVSNRTLQEYILERKDEKAANASINRELAIIKRAFELGLRDGSVSSKPYIEDLPENNVRTGFFTGDGFQSVLNHATPLLKEVATVAYYTGWRLESVILLEWRNVSLERGLMGLTAQQTKNKKATAFPLEPFPELRAVLEQRKAVTKELEKAGIIIPWVFHRDGKKVKSIRKAWEGARARASLPGRKFHDFRRGAVMNLEDLGFTETEIMDMVGLKTRSMFIRYNITTEDRILAKAKRLTAARAKHGGNSRKT